MKTRLGRRLAAFLTRPRPEQRALRGPRACRFCGRVGLHAVGCSRLDRLDAGETS